jgi:hypothetical protein
MRNEKNVRSKNFVYIDLAGVHLLSVMYFAYFHSERTIHSLLYMRLSLLLPWHVNSIIVCCVYAKRSI